MALVSVIIPIYNVENYLERCLDSVINQTIKDIEIILVNDGSTDNSGAICNKYAEKDKRIIVINKKNGGLSDARNKGLDKASGKYIAFVDSDDFIHKDMLYKLVNQCEQLDCDIAIGSHMRFSKIEEIKEVEKIYNPILFDSISAMSNYLADNEDKKIFTMVCDKIYKRELFDDIRFPYGKLYEDGFVTYKLLYKAKKIVYIEDILYYYYQRSGSIMNKGFTLKSLESYDDWRQIFLFIDEKMPELSYLAATKYINKHLVTYMQIFKCNQDKSNDILKIYKKKIKEDLKLDSKKLKDLSIHPSLKLKINIFLINPYLLVCIYQMKKMLAK